MSRPWAVLLIVPVLCPPTASAQPPVRRFDGPGAPPFTVLKAGENPPLDVSGNFVIGPEYTPAPERNRESIRRLGPLEPKLVLFGHGPPLSDTQKFVDFCARV